MKIKKAKKSVQKFYQEGGFEMPRAKLSFEERVLIQDMLDAGNPRRVICEKLNVSSYQLKLEIDSGWIKSEKRYSAEKAQFSLK